MDYSILYGLRNPAFTQDYPAVMFLRQYPTNIDSLDGSGNYNTSGINPGQPQKDTYKKKSKAANFAKNALIAAGIGAAALAGIKFAPKSVKNIFGKVFGKDGKIGSLFSKAADFVKGVFDKIKTKFKK